METRLNVYLARTAGLSRRQADKCIQEGKVSLNGNVVRQPFLRIKASDSVTFEGKLLAVRRQQYFIFHKPQGVTTTRKDPFAAKTVMDFFPKQLSQLFPVGRLDKNSGGLLIMTNDGDLCHRVTHPKFAIEKEYRVTVNGILKADDCRKAQGGIYDNGDFLKVKSMIILKQAKGITFCKVIVCEGKKRHIRRLFKQLGFTVRDLVRMRIGALELGMLRAGEYREVSRNLLYEKVLFKLKKDKTMVG